MPPVTTPPRLQRPIRQPWIGGMSRKQIALVAFLAGFLVFVAGGVLDWLVSRQLLHTKMMMVGGVLVAVFIGSLVFKVLSDAHERHKALLNRLQRIADINHHVRNALQVIAYHARFDQEQSERVIQEINSAVTRIEWVLREVLPEPEEEPSLIGNQTYRGT